MTLRLLLRTEDYRASCIKARNVFRQTGDSIGAKRWSYRADAALDAIKRMTEWFADDERMGR